MTDSTIEVHTENGIEPQGEPSIAPGAWRRPVLIAVLVLLAVLGAGWLFLWWASVADASAAGGCGG